MNKEIEIYTDNFNENKDLERLKEISIYFENLYNLNVSKLNQIKDIYFSDDAMLVDDITSFSNKFFNYDVQLFNLKSKVWNKVLNVSFIDKYLNSDQKITVAKKLNVYYGCFKADVNKETIEPNSENIYKYLSFIEFSKNDLVKENLFNFIYENSFKVLRKHNKPLEFTDYIVFNFINNFKMNYGCNKNDADNLHKSLCAFFDLDFSKYKSIFFLLKDLDLESIEKTYRNEKNYEKIKKEINERRKLKYDYLPDIKIKFFSNTLRLYFYGDAKDKLNKEIIEIYKSKLID